jgi:DNA-binding transcriptional ArsR family regulator
MDLVRLRNDQIRVLAHPLRSRLLGSLRLHGPATATGLASELGTNTGATSYHLRQLAEVGLVAEEERPGSGRQRFWRSAHDMSMWHRSQYDDDPDAAAAADWLAAQQLSRLTSHYEAWLAAEQHEPTEWRDAGVLSDHFLSLNAAQTRALTAEIDAVIDRWRDVEPGPGARQVLLYLATVPNLEERPTGPNLEERPTAGPNLEER